MKKCDKYKDGNLTASILSLQIMIISYILKLYEVLRICIRIISWRKAPYRVEMLKHTKNINKVLAKFHISNKFKPHTQGLLVN